VRPPASQVVVVVVAVETMEDRKGRWWARLPLGWREQFSDIPTFDSEVAETLPYA